MSKHILESLTSAGDDFDVSNHASQILQSCNFTDVAKYVQDLTEADHDLERKLEDHVSTHYQDLLSQATGVERLEAHLSTVSSQAQSLSAAVQRTRSRVMEPYELVRTQTITLARLQETCDLLRRIIRILQLGKKLRSQLQAGPSEIAKAAQSLNELSELWQPEEELSGIDIIEQDQRVLMHARADVEKSADSMLATGMESKNQNQMALALQVYFNLGVLQVKIEELLSKKVKDLSNKMGELLDVQRIVAIANEPTQGPATTSSGGNMPGRPSRTTGSSTLNVSGFRSILWSHFETVLDAGFNACCEMMQLQKILCKKRDLLGNSFFDLLENDKRQVVDLVWSKMLELLKQSLQKGTSTSPLMKETLEGEFPKMVRLFNDLWYRLCQSALTYLVADPSTASGCQLVNPFHEDAGTRHIVRETVLLTYERPYLSKSLSRLFDPINLMFSTSSRDDSTTSLASDQDELRRIFRVVASELSIAHVDQGLLLAVSKNIAKTVHLMCNKSEQMLITETEGAGYPADDYRSNISTVNCLFAFETGIRRCVDESALQDNSEARSVILQSLLKVEVLIKSAIEPLTRSIRDGIDAILLTVHNENFESGEFLNNQQKSPYMKELQTFVSRVSIEFLTPLECKMLLEDHVHNLAAKCVELFVLHVSLVRPIGQSGRSRLASDCSHFESALEPLFNLGQVKDKDPSLIRLRSLQRLLLTDAKDIPTSPAVTEHLLPCSVSLHMLFSYAPPEIKSPHESAGWTIARYITWLDDHPVESDRLQLIQGALEHYVASTRARREKSYAFPYPIMFELLQKAFKSEE